jgi:hypothetical protein
MLLEQAEMFERIVEAAERDSQEPDQTGSRAEIGLAAMNNERDFRSEHET